MTHETEDTDIPKLGQAEPLYIQLPGGLWLEMSDTRANRRGLMIFLRCLRRSDGRPLMSYQGIAQQLGYADRRNVHNFWMSFESCGEDLEAYLVRRKKVDAEFVGLCEQIWKAHPLWTGVEVNAEFARRFPQQAEGIALHNVYAAGHQIGYLDIQGVLRRQLAEGKVHIDEPVLLEALFALAHAGATEKADTADPVDLIPEALEAIRPQGVAQAIEPPAKAVTTEALRTSLLEGDASPCALKKRHGSTQGNTLAYLL